MRRDIKVTDRFDLVVVGGGAAGLWTALKAADEGARVGVVARSPLTQSSSFWAQGGLAAAIATDDSPAAHLADTVAAGRRTSRESAARILVEESPAIVADLVRAEMPFDRDDDGTLALALEGGHSRRRIVHAGGSATGKQITARLAQLVTEAPGITVFEGVAANALWAPEGRCLGVITNDFCLAAPATVLATGGAAALWLRSTNPPGVTGSGMTMAHGAGAALADLEFVQFHPTALIRPTPGKFDGFLITEAVRGEGALLLNGKGSRFVEELAPRDEVARAILHEASESKGPSGRRSVYLDMREVDTEHFPNVSAILHQVGLDPKKDLIPVYPAAHYMMGGIATDIDGRTTLPGLFAVGECACTGLHGANRLASNSLSECFVFGRRAALAAVTEVSPKVLPRPEPTDKPPPIAEESRERLWQHAGLERSAEGLQDLLNDPHPLARLIGQAALERAESRGAHFRVDLPHTDRGLDGQHIVLRKGEEAVWQTWS